MTEKPWTAPGLGAAERAQRAVAAIHPDRVLPGDDITSVIEAIEAHAKPPMTSAEACEAVRVAFAEFPRVEISDGDFFISREKEIAAFNVGKFLCEGGAPEVICRDIKTTAIQLRALADWMDAHAEKEPHDD